MEAVDITEMKVARSDDLIFMCTEGESAVEDDTQILDRCLAQTSADDCIRWNVEVL